MTHPPSLCGTELSHKIVADAELDAGREAQSVCRPTRGPADPAALAFPKGSYLKRLLCQDC